jgi:hypothetical protein
MRLFLLLTVLVCAACSAALTPARHAALQLRGGVKAPEAKVMLNYMPIYTLFDQRTPALVDYNPCLHASL